MKLLLLTVLLASLPPLAVQANEITVRYGPASIQVPVPEGFVQVPVTHPDFVETRHSSLAIGSDLVALFLIPPGPDGTYDFTRQFSIQVENDTEGQETSKADFAAALRASAERRKKRKEQPPAPGARKRPEFEPVHESSDRFVSEVFRLQTDDGEHAGVLTNAVIRGRMWYFYVRSNYSATPQDIAWAKEATSKWIAAIFAASPSDRATLKMEEATPPSPVNLIIKRLVQAGVTLLIILVILKTIRKRAQPPFDPPSATP